MTELQTKKSIFKNWLPLASTWIMMASEGPYIAAIVARMENPEQNLAAFGVTFAIGLLMESPIIMMMAAAARLVKDNQSYLKLRQFNIGLSLLCTGVMLLLLLPPVFDFLVHGLLGLDSNVSRFIFSAMVCMLAWPGMIGYRRFYQGILIRAKSNKRVAIGTIVRLVAMSLTAYLAYLSGTLDGASVGTLSLSVGVTAEAIFVRIAVRGHVKQLRKQEPIKDTELLNLGSIWTFYYPLALTAMIGLTVQPLVTFAMGKAAFPLKSLAVLPVVNSLVFFFRAIPLSFQEVVITLLGEKEENYKSLRDFAIAMGLILTITLSLLTFTPLSGLWFEGLSGLSPDLAAFAWWPLALSLATPSLSLLLCWQRSLLIHRKNTKPVTMASTVELLTISGFLGICLVLNLSYAGVSLAMAALAAGRLASTSYLRITEKV